MQQNKKPDEEQSKQKPQAKPRARSIRLWGVRQNNLKNIDVNIPLGSMTVVCGPSGSGKSSLAFETLYAEGQRRYIESLSNYARQFIGKAPKPELDGVAHIPPALAIEQKNSVRTSRSTVGTSTEILDYLRLLFGKLGQNFCPTYGFVIQKESVTEGTALTLSKFSGQRGYILAPINKDQDTELGLLEKAILKDGYRRLYLMETEPLKGSKNSKLKDKLLDKSKNTSKSKGNDNKDSSTPSKPNCRPPDEHVKMGVVLELPLFEGKTKEEVQNILDKLKRSNIYIVIDRISFSDENRERLSDSLSQAYHASLRHNQNLSGGRATVLTTEGQWINLSEENACATCGFQFPSINPQLFSFNSPLGACPECNGFGNILTLDEQKVIPNPDLSIAKGALHPFTMPSARHDRTQLLKWCKTNNIDINIPWKNLSSAEQKLVWTGDRHFMGVEGLFAMLEEMKYKMHVRVFISRYKSGFTCPRCKGSRLKSEIDWVKVGGWTYRDLISLDIQNLSVRLREIEQKLSSAQREAACELLRQLHARLEFLCHVGVGYLTLDRATRTLSGGEFQRLQLAKILGMGLSQTLFVLDEPTIGLHPRDNDRLIGILKQLQKLGNTLVIVEHDADVIRNSTHIVEIGPGSGAKGGQVLYSGETERFLQLGSDQSITAPYLRGEQNVATPIKPQQKQFLLTDSNADSHTDNGYIELRGCRGHNLKNIDVRIPLHKLVTVSGVSGSGKSTLVTRTLYPALARHLNQEWNIAEPFDDLKIKFGNNKYNNSNIQNVLFVDQAPVGRNERSNPVTYLKVFDAIRSLLAATPEARLHGFTAGYFSLNVEGGRCPVCKGLGYESVDMVFMDNVEIPCEACEGRRFKEETLQVRIKNKNIDDILKMTVAEALEFFSMHNNITRPLRILSEVGLDYIALGQSSSSLSGGESQRLKIARELIQNDYNQAATLYIFDEPTTGLHFREIGLLLQVLRKLVNLGASVILIEHNIDVIRASDWIIDIGPEAGAGGGQIVAEGTAADLIRMKDKSWTGKYLSFYGQ